MRLQLPDPPLGDELVRLRELAATDVPAIAAICADPELAQWLPRVPQPYRQADAEAFVAHIAWGWKIGDEGALAVADPVSDELLGVLGVEPVVRRAGLEIGYWLAPSARGRGVMTRAVQLACGWAFSAGWPRVEALVRPDNPPSRAVLVRAGFLEEGLLRRALDDRGRLRDVAIYSRLPDDP